MLPDGATSIPGSLVGTNITVFCKKGFRASSSLVTLGSLCRTSFELQCGDPGIWSETEQCVPVTCPPFDPDHASLKCTTDGCWPQHHQETVATYSPIGETQYNSMVQISCNSGFRKVDFERDEDDDEDAPARGADFARCTERCSYSQIETTCESKCPLTLRLVLTQLVAPGGSRPASLMPNFRY